MLAEEKEIKHKQTYLVETEILANAQNVTCAMFPKLKL